MSSPVTWLPMLTFTPPSLCFESARSSYLQDDRNNPRRPDRLSLLSWNPGPARGSWDAFIGRVVGPRQIIALQEAADYVQHPSLHARFAVTSFRGCAILFSRNTFECNVGSRHHHVTADTGCADWALEAVVASYEAAPLSQTDRLADCLSSMSTAWTWPNATRRADNARRAGMTQHGTTPDTQSVDSRQSGRSHDQGQTCSNSDAL